MIVAVVGRPQLAMVEKTSAVGEEMRHLKTVVVVVGAMGRTQVVTVERRTPAAGEEMRHLQTMVVGAMGRRRTPAAGEVSGGLMLAGAWRRGRSGIKGNEIVGVGEKTKRRRERTRVAVHGVQGGGRGRR